MLQAVSRISSYTHQNRTENERLEKLLTELHALLEEQSNQSGSINSEKIQKKLAELVSKDFPQLAEAMSEK